MPSWCRASADVSSFQRMCLCSHHVVPQMFGKCDFGLELRYADDGLGRSPVHLCLVSNPKHMLMVHAGCNTLQQIC